MSYLSRFIRESQIISLWKDTNCTNWHESEKTPCCFGLSADHYSSLNEQKAVTAHRRAAFVTPAVSAPSGMLFAQEVPGASTCIVVGGLAQTSGLDLRGYRDALWFVDAASTHPAPRGIAASHLETAPVENPASPEAVARLERFVRKNPRQLPSIFVARSILGAHAVAYQAIVDEMHHHLVPPIEGDAAFWKSLLDEYAELAELAQRAAAPPPRE